MEMNTRAPAIGPALRAPTSGKRIAIVLDASVFSAPTVINKIAVGGRRLPNMESPNEADCWKLCSGRAPFRRLSPSSSNGLSDHRSARIPFAPGSTATAIALILTVLFMLVYYHTAGASADIALLFNLLFILGIMSGFSATLTLPGIAGILITIGVAVDANVLINERVREELAGGKTLAFSDRCGIQASLDCDHRCPRDIVPHGCYSLPVWDRPGSGIRNDTDDRYCCEPLQLHRHHACDHQHHDEQGSHPKFRIDRRRSLRSALFRNT